MIKYSFQRQILTDMKILIPIMLLVFQGCNNAPKKYQDELYPFSKKVNIIGDSLPSLSNSFGLQKKLGAEYFVSDFSIKNSSIRDWIGLSRLAMKVRPDIIILELGTNDALQYDNTEQFKENLVKFLNELADQTPAPILLTALPVTNIPEKKSIIQKNNEFIRWMSYRYKYTDMERVFFNRHFQYYNLWDPLHPNEKGMDAMGDEYSVSLPK